ncbi:50S ribosomal protein L20 [bacterium]|jgi:large subunit ribosomal protein L20|nr:50S ribosomal protein L20 [bacterium]MBT3580864.1 50S ribosomal protein L20 [bacterium]MBT4552430.1 50S ribosomal protein L20 [bacterium]MBT7088031.1 50S ribosomal protein L20 [bacterium]
MTRVKRGNVARQRRKKVLKLAKGFRGSLSKLFKPAKQAVLHALSYAYKDRRNKKRDFRSLWIARINAGLQDKKITYSKFIALLKKNNIQLNRKVLADLAHSNPEVFNEIVVKAQS